MPRLLRRIFLQVPLLVVIVENGGEGGIRTLGSLLDYGALAKLCFRPLSHLTWIGNDVKLTPGGAVVNAAQPAGLRAGRPVNHAGTERGWVGVQFSRNSALTMGPKWPRRMLASMATMSGFLQSVPEASGIEP
jgi:hypothetical protein